MTQQQLIEDNLKLVYEVVHRNFPTFIHDEDIIQCGMLGLVRAAGAWDESKSKFSTFAYRCIKHEIYREFRSRRKQIDTISLNSDASIYSETPTPLEDLIIGCEDIEFVDTIAFYERLSSRDRFILECKQKGMTLEEISKLFGQTKQAISLRMVKMRKEWEKLNGY